MNKRWLWITLTMIICLGFSAGAYAAGDDQPQAKVYLGITPKDGSDGAVIGSVQSNSPAYKANLLPGDVIVSVQGIGVSNWQDLREKILPTLLPYHPTNFVVQRGGARIEKTVVPTGVIRLVVINQEVNFVIPGVREKKEEGPKNAIEALDKINVLKQVVLNPKTGAVEIIGSYDNRFATGPIPYLDLLKTALAYQQPSFSLDNAFTVEEYMEVPPAEFSLDRMYSLVFGHPALERDRQLLIRLAAKPYGISPEEYVKMQNYFMLDDKGGTVPADVVGIVEKALRNMGYEQPAQAWRALEGSAAPDTPVQALRILGVSPGTYPGSIRTQALYALIGILGNKPERYGANIQAVAQGRGSEAELVAAMHKSLLPEWDTAGKQNALISTLQDMILSTAATRELAQTSRSFPIKVVPTDLDPTSQLHRILYAADYSLKSLGAYPELFGDVSGFVSPAKYRGLLVREGKVADVHSQVRYWFEPSKVSMQISDDKTVISFGEAEMRLLNAIMREGTPERMENGALAADPVWDKYCNDFVASYDAYARILPSLHELREVAKVIALARWINAENIPVQLAGIAQEKWNPPSEIEGYWTIDFNIHTLQPGEKAISVIKPMRTFEGGISFKSKHHWTTYTPVPQSETKASNQLSLSAGLGKKAVQMAQSGNLEQAKYLAELSAQAMNGSLSKLDLAKQNIVVPDAKPIPAAPANVQLQKEMLKKTYQQITASSQNSPAGKSSATLAQLSNLYDQVANNPVAASDYLLKLQTGQLPQPAAEQTPADKPPSVTLCGESSLGADALPAARRDYMTRKLNEARERLQHISEALRKLIAINAAEREQLDNLTEQITKDFEAAKERAFDFAVTILVDLPLSKYADVYEEKIKRMEYELKALTDKSKTPMNDAARAALEREIRDKSILKARYADSFALNKKLMELYGKLGYGRDLYEWEKAGKESGAWQKGLEGAAVVGQIMVDNPIMEDYLSKKEWFGGNKVWQVLAMGKMAGYASGFFWDVMDLYGAWGPQAAKLKSDLSYNTAALDYLRQKAEQTAQQVNCWERLLK